MKESTGDVGVNEVMVMQMDTVAFLDAEYKITPVRDGALQSHEMMKKTAFWVFKKTTEFDQAVEEWKSRQQEGTKKIAKFREKQLNLRTRKAQLERGG